MINTEPAYHLGQSVGLVSRGTIEEYGMVEEIISGVERIGAEHMLTYRYRVMVPSSACPGACNHIWVPENALRMTPHDAEQRRIEAEEAGPDSTYSRCGYSAYWHQGISEATYQRIQRRAVHAALKGAAPQQPLTR